MQQGRISKKFDNELVKVIQTELTKQLHKMEDEISEKGYSIPIKYVLSYNILVKFKTN